MPGARIVRRPPEEAGQSQGRMGSVRVLIDASTGSERLLQRILSLPPGASVNVGHPGDGHDVLYVAHGSGLLASAAREENHRLSPGTGALVPCNVPASVHNTGLEELALISVQSPLPFEGYLPLEAHDHPLISLREDDQESLPAGQDRSFKLLIESEHMTQFVGFIDQSKAPPHTHTYEEAIYVLSGEGLVHAEGSTTPIRPGTSIFLPPGTTHCLENQGSEKLKLLGVFSPPGSPADKREEPAVSD
ncbi:MAG TPA: cupin domain-containing protein [Actinomycetota bacterium]|nr:cupin domain-containing protein [Actinomycetota bacterium]